LQCQIWRHSHQRSQRQFSQTLLENTTAVWLRKDTRKRVLYSTLNSTIQPSKA